MDIINTILLRAFISFLMLGSVAGLTVGVILAIQPDWLIRLSQVCNRWISTRHIDKFLEISINIDSWFYRYRRISAFVALIGAIYVLYYFSVQIDKASAISGLAVRFRMPAAYFGTFFGPIVLIAQLGSAFALLVSMVMLFRPSLFLEFEHSANKWVSLRQTMKPLEISRDNVDTFTFHHTRQVGTLLALGSIYVLMMFFIWAT